MSRLNKLEKVIFDLHILVEKLKQNPGAPTIRKEAYPSPEDSKVSEPSAQKIEPLPEIKKPLVIDPASPTIVERFEDVIQDPVASIRRQVAIPPPSRRPPKQRPSFFERNPDLEKFIGENLVNKIGIAILVLAIGFFVKYAIDNNWIGPAGRVGIGILCGGILIGIAHRLRKSYKAFSSVLVGGGLAIFYFTITLAFHQFHLFSQTLSFIILIVITSFAVALSLLYDRQELAVIALAGGISSPFMVSTGNANYNALLIYMIVLNAGLLVIAYFKSWRILNISAFALTVIVLAGVVYTLPGKAAPLAFVYVSLLYLLFFLINIANNIRENKKFIVSDFTVLLVNTALYFSTGLYLLTLMHCGQYRGLFCASIGGLNLLFSFLLFRSKKAEINILYLLIGITLTFLSLTAPIQLHGHFITLFWAAESVLLYWLYNKSDIKLMRLASAIIWVAMLVSLMMDWFNLYSAPGQYDKPTILILPVIANKGFITTVFASVCSFLLYLLTKQAEKIKHLFLPDVYRYGAFILLFLAGLFEVNHQFMSRYPDTDLNTFYLMLYVPAFICLFLYVMDRFPSFKINRLVEAIVLALAILVYLFCSQQYFDTQVSILINHTISPSHLWAHWLSDIFVLLLFYKLIGVLRAAFEPSEKVAAWFLTGALVTFLSLEVCLIVNSIFYYPGISLQHIQVVYVKTGLPVLWGILSFALMWLGMRYKTRVLRIISLTLFTITLIKLFTYDIENIPAGGKIAAFFCLGVLLLIISFMYQKVKYIIKDDGNKPEN
ncbi:MAG TPA: DUF2339 domain-containing protein [Mucilaginibacter sp.]|nr:DUF2339 domain-containing protein [Mucilaginibacter sp.]